MSKNFLFTVTLLAFVLFGSNAYADCSEENAVYKPHASYKKEQLSFTMTIQKPADGQTTLRWNDYIVHAYLGDEEVSTYSMSVTCGNGAAGCYLGGAEFLALNKDLKSHLAKGPAPILVLSNTPNFKDLKNISNNIVFKTPEKIIPNFSKFSMWLLDSCK